MRDFFSENRNIKILAIIAIISLPIFLSIWYGKLNLKMLSKAPAPAPTTSQVTKIYLYCPSIADYCTKGLMLKENNKNLGFGGKVPANTPILAAFNGQATVGDATVITKTGKETLNTITLINPDTKTTAIYYFKGEGAVKPGMIKVGTKIGTITQNIRAYNTSLLFQLYYENPVKAQLQTLNSNSFLITR